MPKEGVTIYTLLISCPGDVTNYIEKIKESVESFNSTFGDFNNIQVVTKHWSTNSYPESGDKPQELLNKQLVRDCDAAVAIFWTRFGTPTDKYGSGTEEEIEEMLLAKKQVFMYFLDSSINPSKINQDQYQKVLKFKEKYKDKGIFKTVDGESNFQKQFSNHLLEYFSRLIREKGENKKESLNPILQIKDLNTFSEEYCSIYMSQLLESEFIKNQKDKIIESFENLNNSILPLPVCSEETSLRKNNLGINPEFYELVKKINKTNKNVEVSDKCVNVINDFAEENQINIEENFWNLGNLKIDSPLLQFPYIRSGPSYSGTDEERERYSLLKELYISIKKYNEYIEYFGYIDNIKAMKLIISNLGNTIDEDIDVKLIIPKGCIIKHKDLPYPGINIIEDLFDKKFFDLIFSIQDSDAVNSYKDSNKIKLNFRNINKLSPIVEKEIMDEYEDNKHDYQNLLDDIFLYKQFENSDSDILIFDIDYLKHNSSMAFPSILMFKKLPEVIEYEIKSKNTPKIIKGKMYIKDDVIVLLNDFTI